MPRPKHLILLGELHPHGRISRHAWSRTSHVARPKRRRLSSASVVFCGDPLRRQSRVLQCRDGRQANMNVQTFKKSIPVPLNSKDDAPHWHQASNPNDGGCAQQRSRRTDEKISSTCHRRSLGCMGTIMRCHADRPWRRRALEAQLDHPCGSSSRTRTRYAPPKSSSSGSCAGRPPSMRWYCGLPVLDRGSAPAPV